MFGPTASPVVQAQRTWHIGPTTCVFTSRRRAWRESVGSSRRGEPVRIAGSSGSTQRARAIASAGVGADEARGARDPIGEHVGTHRSGRGRAARHREGQAALGVGERDVHRLRRCARSRRPPPIPSSSYAAELERDGAGGDRDHGDARRAPRPRRRTAPGRRRSRARRRRGSPGARGSTSASFFRGQRTALFNLHAARRRPGRRPACAGRGEIRSLQALLPLVCFAQLRRFGWRSGGGAVVASEPQGLKE